MQTTWTEWLADALSSAKNRHRTGKFDAVTPQPMYVMMRPYKVAGIAIIKIIIHLPMQLLYRIVQNWDQSVASLQGKDFCPPIPDAKFTLKEPRHATTQLPLVICRKIMPSAPALHGLLVQQNRDAAWRSLYREWGQYVLPRADNIDSTMDIPINIWLDEPKASDMAHVPGEARQANFMNQLETASETPAEEAVLLLSEVIEYREVHQSGTAPLEHDEEAARASRANPTKLPHILWDDIQPFLEDASGKTLTYIQEQKSVKNRRPGLSPGQGFQKRQTMARIESIGELLGLLWPSWR